MRKPALQSGLQKRALNIKIMKSAKKKNRKNYMNLLISKIRTKKMKSKLL